MTRALPAYRIRCGMPLGVHPLLFLQVIGCCCVVVVVVLVFLEVGVGVKGEVFDFDD